MSEVVAVLHAAVGDAVRADREDALHEAMDVSGGLRALGYEPVLVEMGLNLQAVVDDLVRLSPLFVFNLVEDVAGDGRLITLAPAVLEHLGLAYTGAQLDSTYLTSNKLITKEALARNGIATPPACLLPAEVTFHGPYIVKPVWEDASVGLDESSVAHDRGDLERVTSSVDPRHAPYFVERYVDGREFAVSMLEGPQGPEVLPVPETLFRSYPPGKPRVLGYRAKWDNESFEYRSTVRTWDLPGSDTPLLEELAATALQCWRLVGLRGYGRVDFRVDKTGKPWVIDVNANPCIASDAGFMAAAGRIGLDLTQVVARIVAAVRIQRAR
jgi:D-alanine-D-alanine ligase